MNRNEPVIHSDPEIMGGTPVFVGTRHVEHLVEFHNQVEIALYCGTPEIALTHIRRAWPDLSRSLLLNVQTLAIQMYSLRARAVLAAAAARPPSERRRFLREARMAARYIRRHRLPWGEGLADPVEAAVARLTGADEVAHRLLQHAEESARLADMKLHVAAARWARGRLESSSDLIADGKSRIVEQDVRNPLALASVMAPGLLP